ncbi:MAG: beta-galactosidase, partial [Muribaculaceae bacterium]|nr:beta-galactosidase [Muribaculaceae bacterium]
MRHLFSLSFLGAIALGAASQETIDFNFGWKFFPGQNPGAEAVVLDESEWQTVNLPHDFQISQPWVEPEAGDTGDKSNLMANIASKLSSRGFKEMGEGWYRKTFTPDPSWEGKRVLVDFEGIMLVGDVYLNGERIGGTDYGYLGFESDISKKLKYGEPNVIAVKADTGKPENSRWYTGGGLYRDVKLKIGDPKQYFTRNSLYITTSVADADRSTILVGGELANYIKTDSITVGIEIL